MCELVIDLGDKDLATILANEEFNKAVIEDMNSIAAKNKLSGLEKLKQILIIEKPFTIEDDIMTPSMKLKRNVAKKVFEKEIKELYSRPI